jgi:hypothetical protein
LELVALEESVVDRDPSELKVTLYVSVYFVVIPRNVMSHVVLRLQVVPAMLELLMRFYPAL